MTPPKPTDQEREKACEVVTRLSRRGLIAGSLEEHAEAERAIAQALADHAATARAEQRKRDADALCGHCEDGLPLERIDRFTWAHRRAEDGSQFMCRASDLRYAIEKETPNE